MSERRKIKILFRIAVETKKNNRHCHRTFVFYTFRYESPLKDIPGTQIPLKVPNVPSTPDRTKSITLLSKLTITTPDTFLRTFGSHKFPKK